MALLAKSIRWRLVAWQGLILAVVVAGFCVTAYQLESARRFRSIDEALQQRNAAVVLGLAPGPPPEEGGSPAQRPPGRRGFETPPDDSRPDRRPATAPSPGARRRMNRLFENGEFYYIVWYGDGRMQASSTNTPGGVTMPVRESAEELGSARMRGTNRELIHFTSSGRCILTGRPIDAELAQLRRFAFLLASVGAGVLALGLVGGWWVATRAIRPIKDISATAARIAGGDLSQRINTAGTENELGQLAGVLNSTFARLEAAFAQQKQFTADASHELRTPLAVMISEAQTTLTRERTAVEYRETVEACLDAAQQMRRLTESLLELARFDAGQRPFQRGPVNLSEVARDSVALVHPLADPRGIRIESEFAIAEVRGDAELLNRVVTNLLTNAIHYNKPDGEVRIATRSENGTVILTVADTGVGIAPEEAPHIFERFYRADKSRARANGRAGLGLAICKAIVDAHGGSIEVTSTPGNGAVFTVRLPATP